MGTIKYVCHLSRSVTRQTPKRRLRFTSLPMHSHSHSSAASLKPSSTSLVLCSRVHFSPSQQRLREGTFAQLPSVQMAYLVLLQRYFQVSLGERSQDCCDCLSCPHTLSSYEHAYFRSNRPFTSPSSSCFVHSFS